MAQVIGKVTKLEGVAYAIDPATGEARTLLKGDPVYIGEVIKTAPGTVIAVEMRDGSLLTLGETSALQLSEDLLRPADTEEAIAEADVLKRALAEGQLDINDINTQQPTAAGGSASSALDGDISIFELSSAEGEVHAGFDTFVEQETPDFQEQEDGLFTPTQPINRPPEVINPLRGLQSSDDGEQISLDASQFFGDPDGDTLTYSASGLPAGLSIDPATGVISGTIDRSASQSGPYTVTVTATDPAGASTSTQFTWNVANPAPSAVDDSATTAEDTAISGNVLTNDSDPDGDPLSVTQFTINGTTYNAGDTASLTEGQLTLNSDGSWTFQPAANYNGPVPAVSYTVSDGEGGTATATLNITVTPANDAPVVTTPVADQSSQDADTVSLDVSGAFSDPDGDTLTYSASGLPAGLSIDPATGVISGTIDRSASQSGPYTVTVTATDPAGASTSTQFTWNVANPAPSAVDDSATTAEDTAISGNVLTNDSDPDGDPLSVTQFTINGTTYNAGDTASLTEGQLTLNSDGSWTFQPAANYNGPVPAVSYTVSDGEGGTATATLNITVTPVNDGPVVLSDDDVAVSEEGLSGGITDNTGDPTDTTNSATATGTLVFSDPDSSTFTLSLTGPTSQVTSGGEVLNWSWDAASRTLTGGNSAGAVMTVTLAAPVATGNGQYQADYTVTLHQPLDHPVNSTEDVLDIPFGYTVSDGQYSDNGSFTVSVEDDRPVSGPISNDLTVPLAKANVMLILDFSGSMQGQNLADMKAAVISMLDAYDRAGYAVVQLVTFSTNASIPNDGGWVSIDDAKAFINGLTDADMGGVTNYDDALAKAQAAFAETAGYIQGGRNIAYFLSDGAPYPSGNEVDSTEQAAWEQFLRDNQIDSYAVGFGSPDIQELEPIAYNGIDDVDRPAIDATAAGTNLTDSLLETVTQVVPGNLFGTLTAGGFGADGAGSVQQLTIDGVSYTYDVASDTISDSNGNTFSGHELTVTTSQNGTLTVNMQTGAYSYAADPAFSAAYSESIDYALVDRDGDATSGTLTLNVDRAVKPTAVLTADADDVYESALPTGTNPSSPAEVATGSLFANDTIPNGFVLKDVSIAGGTTVDNGTTFTVTTAEGNTLVVDKATGNYTYTLLNPVSHAGLQLVHETFDNGVDGWSNAQASTGKMLIDRDTTVSKLFDFGSGYAGQTVTISFDMNIVGDWESSGSWQDFFHVYVNGTEYESQLAGQYDGSGITGHAYSFDVQLDANGRALVELNVDSTANDEKAEVDNFKIVDPSVTDIQVDHFTYTVVDPGQTAYTGNLDVTIHDDVPVVGTQNQQVDVPQQDTNLMIILDLSGSMTNNSQGVDRLAAARSAINDLIDAYDGYGDVAVRLVTFSTTAEEQTTYWMSAAEAKAVLDSLTAGGWTNYDAALAQAMQSWDDGSRITTPPAGGTLNNVAYFISDGQPNANDGDPNVLANAYAGTDASDGGIQPAEEATWKAFLEQNGIKAYALGIGDGLSAQDQQYLDPVAYDGVNGTDMDAIMVPDVNNLSEVLQATAVSAASGNLLTSSGTLAAQVGADGGYVSSITINGVTFDWDGSSDTVSASGTASYTFDADTHVLSVVTAAGGTLAVDMDDGGYNYYPPISGNGTINESFDYTLTDSDGDSASGTLNLTVNFNEHGLPSVTGDGGQNTLTGTANAEILSGLGGNDTLIGQDGDDRLYGGDGQDQLDGGAGNDLLVGGDGNDTLLGGVGDDLLVGGLGDDTLTGGSGQDTFYWQQGDVDGTDTITDFITGQNGDVLDLKDLLAGENAGNLDQYLSISSDGTDTTIVIDTDGSGNVGSQATIVLEGVDLTQGGTLTEQQIIQQLLADGNLEVDQ